MVDPVAGTTPPLAVVIPVRNERQHLPQVLADLQAQNWPHPFTVVVADGRSDDGTREFLADCERQQPWSFRLVVVDNPAGHIPHGLNAAVRMAEAADLIIRVDGHSRLPPEYVRTMATALLDGTGDVVGPQIRLLPGRPGPLAELICDCLASPLGTGGTPSRSRLPRARRTVHTVMSSWRRSVWEANGGFDERLLSNEDFDFDWRAHRSGRRVVSLPIPTYGLLARGTLGSLWRQRWRYGWWKAAVLKKAPASLQVRQLLPPLAGAVFFAALEWLPAALTLLAFYLLLSWLVGGRALLQRRAPLATWLLMPLAAPVVFAVIHGGWTLGLVLGLVANHLPAVERADPVASGDRIGPVQPPILAGKRIAVVHEWLETWGGSELVLTEILRCLPQADLFTLVDFRDARCRAALGDRPATTSCIQRLPFARRLFRWYYPFFPLAVERLPLQGYDLVISSSHAVAKGVLTGPDQVHLCYCHSPMRYAWDQEAQYTRRLGWGAVVLRPFLHYLRLWDLAASARVDFYLANSAFVARRIRKFYRRRAEVVHPPVEVRRWLPTGVPPEREAFFLTVARLVPYKRVDLLIEAFNGLPDRRLVVVGSGPELARMRALAGPNVEVRGHLPDPQVVDLMARCAAFVFAGEEDFGIVLAEALACGTPVIAYGHGGAAEIVADGQTGILFPSQDPASVREAVARFERWRPGFDPAIARVAAERFAPERFRAGLLNSVERALGGPMGEAPPSGSPPPDQDGHGDGCSPGATRSDR